MDFIIELVFELIAEGTVELSKSTKVPKLIRYPLIVIIVLFVTGIFGIILFAGLMLLKENVILGIVLIAIALLMLVMGIVKFRKGHLK
ncbi:MAG: hypothetical protein E7505_00020 [Ruminococcus sp.]|nr:hypothetical protein [Ruminococcus sp.]